MVNKPLQLWGEAIQAFEKIQSVVFNAPEVLYQMAQSYESVEKYKPAQKWYNVLVTRVISDPHVLLKIANLYMRDKDETQAVHY